MHYQNLQKTVFYDQIEDMAKQVQSGDTVAIGGLWFIRLPMAMIDALIQQNVRDLTVVTQAGGLAVEQLIAAGMVKKVIFSFLSLDLFGLSPLFRNAAQKGEIEYEEWTALQMNTALEAARLGLEVGVLQPPEGSVFDQESAYYRRIASPFGGKDVGVVRALVPDVVLIHAGQADEDGNIAISGAQGIDRSLIGAAKKTFVTVEEIVSRGNFTKDTRATVFPRFLVNGICAVKYGAYPCSCLPYYATDYPHLQQVIGAFGETGKYENLRLKDRPEQRDVRLKAVQALANVSVDAFAKKVKAQPNVSTESHTVHELMACLMAAELEDNMVSTVGSNTPLSMVAYLLAKKTHAPNLTVTPFCGLTDIPVMPLTLSLMESFCYQSAVTHWSIEDLWQWIYQKSLTAVEFGGAAQIDASGNINNSEIRDADGRCKVRLPGQAGLADILNLHHNAYYYITSHDKRRIVEQVSYQGGKHQYVSDEQREKQGLPPGKMKIITNLCVMELNKQTKQLVVTHIHPGVEKTEILEQTGFPITFSSDLKTSALPTKEQLRLIRAEIDPFEMRKMEFLSGEERLAFIADILALETRWMEME